MNRVMILTVFATLSLGALGTATANACHEATDQVTSCPVTAAQTAQAACFAKTGCEESAKAEAAKAMAEVVYANALDETGCAEAAAKTVHEYVREHTACSATAAVAYQHAVAKVAHDRCLADTGCSLTAEIEYKKASEAAAAEVANLVSDGSVSR